MSHKSLTDIPARDGRALKSWCERNPNARSIREKGDHVTVEGPRGSATFCDREMGTGLWHKVIKQLIAVGLALFACGLVYHFAQAMSVHP